ncbi:hypothetical protein XELAEV_18016350mg [Xenopus laevis]|uniref:Uncharacterized protein n=1 Tax=Xenopus laevis TaxID=8355 RepID=A0A974DJU4_XENLA|nr:hypothetical protein XELAEV_18016350mg [Xenopus laevis]
MICPQNCSANSSASFELTLINLEFYHPYRVIIPFVVLSIAQHSHLRFDANQDSIYLVFICCVCRFPLGYLVSYHTPLTYQTTNWLFNLLGNVVNK